MHPTTRCGHQSRWYQKESQRKVCIPGTHAYLSHLTTNLFGTVCFIILFYCARIAWLKKKKYLSVLTLHFMKSRNKQKIMDGWIWLWCFRPLQEENDTYPNEMLCCQPKKPQEAQNYVSEMTRCQAYPQKTSGPWRAPFEKQSSRCIFHI